MIDDAVAAGISLLLRKQEVKTGSENMNEGKGEHRSFLKFGHACGVTSRSNQ